MIDVEEFAASGATYSAANLHLPSIADGPATVSLASLNLHDDSATALWCQLEYPIFEDTKVLTTGTVDTQPNVPEPVADEVLSMKEFVEGICSVYESFASKQEALEPEAYAAWQANLEDMYWY